jgi:transposase
MPAQYVKPYLKGHKNDYRDAEAIAEAVQRPTIRLAMRALEALLFQSGGARFFCVVNGEAIS